MEKVKISDYLSDYNKIEKKGRCRACLTTVFWSTDRLSSHKRANCEQATEEDKLFFNGILNSKKMRIAGASCQQPNTSTDLDETNSSLQLEVSKDMIDEAVANLFLRTGMSFRIADSPAWKHLITLLNPTYAKNMPSARVISGTLLKKTYEKSKSTIKTILDESGCLILTSDGWANVNNDHIVNFTVKSKNNQSFFLKSINTLGVSQTATTITNSICAVLEEVGVEKFSAVITDNPNVMQAAWKLIEGRYPHIAAYGCAAHGVNLLIKDITNLPLYASTIKDSTKVIQFIKNHQSAYAMFEEKRKEAAVQHKLSTSVPTRWCSEYDSAQNLLKAKVILVRMSHENAEELGDIQPRAKSLKALELMQSQNFWLRLEKLVSVLEPISISISKFLNILREFNFKSKKILFSIIEKLEADDAPLNLVYSSFGRLYQHFKDQEDICVKVKHRWDFMSTEASGISYMLTPKFSADGFYIDNDRLDIIDHVEKFTENRFPGFGFQAKLEMMNFVAKMASLTVLQKEKYFEFNGKNFWSILGRHEFPVLYKSAHVVNEMTCSSAASERVWSIFRFVHSRLRNRLADDKVEMLAFIYINCAILDKNDKIDYLTEIGTDLNGKDYEDD